MWWAFFVGLGVAPPPSSRSASSPRSVEAMYAYGSPFNVARPTPTPTLDLKVEVEKETCQPPCGLPLRVKHIEELHRSITTIADELHAMAAVLERAIAAAPVGEEPSLDGRRTSASPPPTPEPEPRTWKSTLISWATVLLDIAVCVWVQLFVDDLGIRRRRSRESSSDPLRDKVLRGVAVALLLRVPNYILGRDSFTVNLIANLLITLRVLAIVTLLLQTDFPTLQSDDTPARPERSGRGPKPSANGVPLG